MRAVLVSLWLAGCGFQPNPSGPPGGDGNGPGSDAQQGSDAQGPGDAKMFMDAPASTSGSLTVTSTTLGTSDLDLSNEGTTDWAHWGYQTGVTGFDRKNGGNAISDLAATPMVSFGGAPFTASWSNGTPHPNVSMTSSGVAVHQGSAMTFTVNADTTPRTLRLYVGAQAASARLDVSLSDSSAADVTKTLSAGGTTNVRYTITFNAASAGRVLTVSWTDTNDSNGSGNCFAALLEATLQ